MLGLLLNKNMENEKALWKFYKESKIGIELQY